MNIYKLLCCFLIASTQAMATGSWLSADLRGYHAFQAGQYQLAAKSFQNCHWKGLAYYRAGDYANAILYLQTLDGAQAHYNLGNAFAQLGEYQQAITAYRAALQINPHLKDAEFNLALLEKGHPNTTHVHTGVHTASIAQPISDQTQKSLLARKLAYQYASSFLCTQKSP